MYTDFTFTKDNLDTCLNKLAKEFRKINGRKMSAEIVLIGGAAILANYGFRNMTYDIDAIIQASSSMKEAINKVGDEMGLPNGWLNSDFTQTSSYSPKLLQYSKYYKRFGYVLDVRTVSGEYLIAMKLMSGRQYKNDISDIIGILQEQQKREEPISLQMIESAVINLYGSWESLPESSRELISKIMENNQLNQLYEQFRISERAAKESLIHFEQKYPGVTNSDNANDIIQNLKKRKEREQ